MFKRSIYVEQVKHAIMHGEEINFYPEDKPYPSKLLLVIENEIPLHVVIAENSEHDEIIVVTTYIPEKDIWNDTYKSKR